MEQFKHCAYTYTKKDVNSRQTCKDLGLKMGSSETPQYVPNNRSCRIKQIPMTKTYCLSKYNGRLVDGCCEGEDEKPSSSFCTIL
jgi:hypothetical protein